MNDLTKDDFNIGECTVEKQDKAYIKIFVDTIDDAERTRNQILHAQETIELVKGFISQKSAQFDKFTKQQMIDTIEMYIERPDLFG